MSGITLQEIPFNDMLPSSINQDETIQNVSKSIDPHLQKTEQDIDNILIWSRIDEAADPLLSTLAWQFSLTHEYIWKLAESDTAKRELLKSAKALHKHKGTPWAVRQIIRALGFGEVDLIEGQGIRYRNGAFTRNGYKYHIGFGDGWPCYRVILKQPITNDLAVLLKEAIPEYAPERCLLISLDFKQAAIRHNGFATRNGSYNRGEVVNG